MTGLRRIAMLTLILLAYLLCNQRLRGKISARARYFSGILLMILFLIPLPMTTVVLHVPDWVYHRVASEEVISIGSQENLWQSWTSGFSETMSDVKDSFFAFRSAVVISWSVGIAVCMFRAVRKHVLFCQTVRRCSLAPSDELVWQNKMLCGKIGISHQPRLLVCRRSAAMRLGAPFTFGVFRPTVVMPGGVSGEEAELLLAHELHHLKHRDVALRALMLVMKILYWWYLPIYPFVNVLEAVCEEACDESMTDGKNTEYRAAYAKLLVKFASDSAQPFVSFSNAGKLLRKRIEALFSDSIRREGYWLILLLLGISVLFLGVKTEIEKPFHNGITGEAYLQAIESSPLDPFEADVAYAFREAGRIDDLAFGTYASTALHSSQGLFYRHCVISFIILESADGTSTEVHYRYPARFQENTCVGVRIVYDGKNENGRKQYTSIEIVTGKKLLDCYTFALLYGTENNHFQIPDYPLTDTWIQSLLAEVRMLDPEREAFFQTLIQRATP